MHRTSDLLLANVVTLKAAHGVLLHNKIRDVIQADSKLHGYDFEEQGQGVSERKWLPVD